jgi:hypothetical protein
MTAAEFAAMVDDVVLTMRRHVIIDDEPAPVPQRPVVTATAVAGDGKVTLGWSIAPESVADLVTGWVPRRGGKDRTNAGPWSPATPDPPQARSRRFDKLVNGVEYEFGVRALLADGTTVEAQPVTATPAAAGGGPAVPGGLPVDRVVPLVGRSGLAVNSIAFTGSASLAAVEELGRARGRDFDGMLHFTAREAASGSWNQFRSWYTTSHRDWLAAGRLLVTSLPHAPTPRVGGKYTPAALAMNQRGADDAYREQQRAFGRWLVESGLNWPTHVLRCDWEFNGDWYAWSAKNGGAVARRRAVENFVTNVRGGGATRVLFDDCTNKGPSQSGVDFDAIPGPEFVDILGGDIYDHWQATRSDADWTREINRRPGLATLAAEAARRGVMWSVDECGNSHSPAGGGDNPFYWRKMREFLDEHAERCAWWCTYDHDGLPANLRHTLRKYNPQSWAVYRDLFGNA